MHCSPSVVEDIADDDDEEEEEEEEEEEDDVVPLAEAGVKPATHTHCAPER